MTTQTQILLTVVLVAVGVLLWVVGDHLLSRPAPLAPVEVKRPGLGVVLSGSARVREGADR